MLHLDGSSCGARKNEKEEQKEEGEEEEEVEDDQTMGDGGKRPEEDVGVTGHT